MNKFLSPQDALREFGITPRPPRSLGGPLVLTNDPTPLSPAKSGAGWQLPPHERVVLRQQCPDGWLVLFPGERVRCFTSLEASDTGIRRWQETAAGRHAVRDLPPWEPEPEVIITDPPLPPWRV
jgi:hypothetical protein